MHKQDVAKKKFDRRKKNAKSIGMKSENRLLIGTCEKEKSKQPPCNIYEYWINFFPDFYSIYVMKLEQVVEIC